MTDNDVSKQGVRRRGHNEGSIYQRADGRWVASVTVGNGRRKDVYGATRRQVAERLTKLQRDIQAGLPLVSEVVKVEHYLTEWLSGIEPHLRPRSYAPLRRSGELAHHTHPWRSQPRQAHSAASRTALCRQTERGAGSRFGGAYPRCTPQGACRCERLEVVQRNVASLARAPRGRT